MVRALRREWPDGLPLAVRMVTSDWADGGWAPDEAVELAKRLKAEGVDLIDCVAGGGPKAEQPPYAPGFLVPHAERIKREAGVLTATAFLTDAAHGTDPEPLDGHVRGGRVDLVLLAREMLRNPYRPVHAAATLGVKDGPKFPPPYDHWLGGQVLGGRLHTG
ncbi:MAG: hypothetical protein K2X87_34235 [Gemmataceae bacterium]|nr:hypothetical protein [Gemmataceae bacterium]